MTCRHELSVAVKRYLAVSPVEIPLSFIAHPESGAAVYQRSLRRIADLPAFRYRGVVAEYAAKQQLSFARVFHIKVRRRYLFSTDVIILYRHFVLRERSRLVRAYHGNAAQAFDGLQLPDDGVFLSHLLRTERQHDRHDRTECLRYRGYSQSYCKQECISYSLTSYHAYAEQYPAEYEYQYRKLLTEVVEIVLERSFLLRRRFQEGRYLSYLCFHAYGRNEEFSSSVSNEASRVDHVQSVAERHCTFYHRGILFHSQTFACKCAFICSHACIRDDPAVCRDEISRFQTYKVSDRYLCSRHLDELPVPEHFGLRS